VSLGEEVGIALQSCLQKIFHSPFPNNRDLTTTRIAADLRTVPSTAVARRTDLPEPRRAPPQRGSALRRSHDGNL
jgi:hypothetical protein